MADRTLTIRIGANVTDLVSKLRVAQQATNQWADRTQARVLANREHLNTLATGFGLLGAGMLAAGAVAVRAFADFDAAMSSVQASTMESADNMELLRQAALDAGQETVYSATEAAAAIEELAKAGVSTEDILGGGLAGALDLAASGAIDVADAATIAATAMTQFGLSGEDVEHIADLLAAGAGKAQGGVDDLGQALNQAGLVASQFGLSIDETVGTLTAFASAGLLGSDAGTSFRTMLLRLANPAGEAADLMKDLGINAYDAQGNFVGMESLAGQLRDALGGLTQAQRDQALAMIFGQDAIRAANVLYSEGAEGIAEWTAAVDDAGFASEQAAIRMDNLKGDIEQFLGAIETALVGAGEGADGPLRSLVQGATDVVNAFSDLPDPVKQATGLIAGAGGLAALGLAGMLKMTAAVADARVAFQNLGISARTAGVAVGGAAIGLAVLTAAVSIWATKSAEGSARADLYADAVREVGDAARESAQDIAANAIITGEGISWGFLETARSGYHSLADALEGLGSNADEAAAAVAGTQEEFDAYIQSLDDGALSLADVEVIAKLNEQRTAISEAKEESERLAEANIDVGATQDDMEAAVENATAAVQEQTDSLQENIEAQREAAGIVLSQRDAQRQWEQSLDDATAALEENGATLDLTTQAGRDNQAALDDVAASGWDLIDSMRANGATQEELQDTMQSTRDRFIKLATSMGMSADDAEALADELNLIPDSVTADVRVNTADATYTINEFLNRQRYLNIQARVFDDPSYRPAQYSGGKFAYASGGPVIGPGSGTSDSIVARLSNGEHVWTAREVAAAGGHGAISALRQMALSGKFAASTPAFAGGGPVMLGAPAPSVTVVQQQGGGTGGLTVGQIVAADPRAAVREFDALLRREMTR